MKICLIVAVDENNGIGKNNQLLCHLPNDLKFFKKTTMGFPVVMGRKTFESIGRPLPGRRNLVLSRQQKEIAGCELFHDLSLALESLKQSGIEQCFIIGGDSIYKQALPLSDEVYLTKIHHAFEADAFFPTIDLNHWKLEFSDLQASDEKNAYSHSFQKYVRA